MAVKIRLSRIGTTNRPFYRLIAVDSRKKRDGAQLANIGTYDPVNGTVVQFHEEIYQEWLSKGALATDSAKKVYRLYKKNSITPETAVAQEDTVEKTA
jgi:small subunit ribosomal protein S16